ncbi:MAG: hypothetical protein PHV68_09075 [Candidatus Gastranaerophilales bacterium]|nr:hypothetical protein [Candidatus Gastranaerophilales bacterium]
MCKSCFEKLDYNFSMPIKIIHDVPVYAVGIYENNLKKLIRGLKYHKKKDLAVNLAKFIYLFLDKNNIDIKNHIIVPVPLHKNRQKQRKYNHMDLVANELSKLCSCKINTTLIKRIKDTKPLYKLNRIDRMKELKDAFEIDKLNYNNEPILIIDDITTSGATLEEIIKNLQTQNIKFLKVIVSATP